MGLGGGSSSEAALVEVSVDRLETARLLIRPFTPDDLDAAHVLLDEELAWSGRGYTREQRREQQDRCRRLQNAADEQQQNVDDQQQHPWRELQPLDEGDKLCRIAAGRDEPGESARGGNDDQHLRAEHRRFDRYDPQIAERDLAVIDRKIAGVIAMGEKGGDPRALQQRPPLSLELVEAQGAQIPSGKEPDAIAPASQRR